MSGLLNAEGEHFVISRLTNWRFSQGTGCPEMNFHKDLISVLSQPSLSFVICFWRCVSYEKKKELNVGSLPQNIYQHFVNVCCWFIIHHRQFDWIRLASEKFGWWENLKQIWMIHMFEQRAGFRCSSKDRLLVLVCWFQWLCTNVFGIYAIPSSVHLLVSFKHKVKFSMHRW